LHDLAKEQKVAPMVVECINCEYFCHEGDANLPFDAELSNIKISLRMKNKLHHMLHPDVMYYGLRMVQVSPLHHLLSTNLNVNWNDNCFAPILAMELKTSGKTLLLSN
jgi:hypothetical protein